MIIVDQLGSARSSLATSLRLNRWGPRSRMNDDGHIVGICLEDHPRTWIRGDRMGPPFKSHGVKGHLEGGNNKPYLGDLLSMVFE